MCETFCRHPVEDHNKQAFPYGSSSFLQILQANLLDREG